MRIWRDTVRHLALVGEGALLLWAEAEAVAALAMHLTSRNSKIWRREGLRRCPVRVLQQASDVMPPVSEIGVRPCLNN